MSRPWWSEVEQFGYIIALRLVQVELKVLLAESRVSSPLGMINPPSLLAESVSPEADQGLPCDTSYKRGSPSRTFK